MHQDEFRQYNMFCNYLSLPAARSGDGCNITLPPTPRAVRPLIGRQQTQDPPENIFNAENDKSSFSLFGVGQVQTTAFYHGGGKSQSFSSLSSDSTTTEPSPLMELSQSDVVSSCDSLHSSEYLSGFGEILASRKSSLNESSNPSFIPAGSSRFTQAWSTNDDSNDYGQLFVGNGVVSSGPKGFFNKAVGGPVLDNGGGSDRGTTNRFIASSRSSGRLEEEFKFSNGNDTSCDSFEIGHWSDFVEKNNIGDAAVKSATNSSSASASSTGTENSNGTLEIGHWSDFVQNNNSVSATRNTTTNGFMGPSQQVVMETNGFGRFGNSMNGFQQFGRRGNNDWNRRRTPDEGMLCVFCRRNGETKEFYTTHVTKDSRGRVICPILRKYVCPECKATGDGAHTIRHCPVRKMKGLV